MITTPKKCCTQTNGDGEDSVPPAPEDQTRLKVILFYSLNKSMTERKFSSTILAVQHCRVNLLITYIEIIVNFHVTLQTPKQNKTNCSAPISVGGSHDTHSLSVFPQLKPSLQRGGSSASLHNSTMRNTIFHLMIHTLDPLGEGE